MATAAASQAFPHITKDPRVCGGKACIDRTRIRVIDVAELEREGYQPRQMLDAFAVELTLGQVHSALAYAAEHPEEVEADFVAGAIAEAEIDQHRAEYLARRSKP